MKSPTENEQRMKENIRLAQIIRAITQAGPLPHAELLNWLPGLQTTNRVRKIVSIGKERGLLQGLTGDGDLPKGLRKDRGGAAQYVEISRAAGGCVVGLNVGRTYFAIGVADPNGRLLSVNGEPPEKGLTGKAKDAAWADYRAGQIIIHKREAGVNGRSLLKRTAKKTVEWLEELGVAEEEIRGITLSLPVPVSTTQGKTLTASIEPSLANVKSIKTAFRSELGKNRYPKLEKVVLANDADVAARGEVRYGNAYGLKDVIAIHAAYGIGAGVIADGSVLRTGAGGGVGEIGHCVPTIIRDEGAKHGLIPLDPENDLFTCVCDCPGHLEAMAGGEAIVKRIEASLGSDVVQPPKPLSTVLEDPEASLAAKLDGLLKVTSGSKPWKPGREAMLDAAHAIGGAIHTLTHLFKPEAVLLCGKLSEAGKPFLKVVQEGFDRPGSLASYAPSIELGDATDEFARRLIMVRGAAMTAIRATEPLILRQDPEHLGGA